MGLALAEGLGEATLCTGPTGPPSAPAPLTLRKTCGPRHGLSWRAVLSQCSPFTFCPDPAAPLSPPSCCAKVLHGFCTGPTWLLARAQHPLLLPRPGRGWCRRARTLWPLRSRCPGALPASHQPFLQLELGGGISFIEQVLVLSSLTCLLLKIKRGNTH